MLTINVKHNIDAVVRQLTAQQKQIAYATARALTATANDVARDLTTAIPQVFDRPTPFTQKAIGMEWAKPSTLRSRVFIKDIQAAYLRLEVAGGTRIPKKRALVVPAGVLLNSYGNMSRHKLKSLLARKDVFSGRVRGVPGIWQRTRKGLKLLVAYEPQAQYQERFPFLAIAKKTVARTLLPNFRLALAQALRTAK